VPSDIEIVPVLNVAVSENYSQRGGRRLMATVGFVIAVPNKSRQALTPMGKQLGAFQVIKILDETTYLLVRSPNDENKICIAQPVRAKWQ